MLRIVAYDIADAKRLRRIAKICELYGFRIEKSVFECELSKEKFEKFWQELKKIANEKEDCLAVYKVCKSCKAKIKTFGQVSRPEINPCLFFG